MNFGSPDEALLAKSKAALSNYMECAAQIGAEGVIFHSGSHMGQGFEAVLPQTVAALREVLAASPEGPNLLIENCAGMGNHIGASFTQIGRIMDGIDSPRVKVCLDTQHCFAAGYDVSQADSLNEAMAEFDAAIGLTNLIAVHANDAKTPFASGVDRQRQHRRGTHRRRRVRGHHGAPRLQRRSLSAGNPGRGQGAGPHAARPLKGHSRQVGGRLMGVRLSSDDFQQLVAKALDTLPQEALELLDNVDVLTQLWPSSDQMEETDTTNGYGLLGLYEGTPLIDRDHYNWALPDRVTLFQRPIEAICDTREELEREVQITVVHELAHHFGWSDEEIHRMGFG